MKIISRESTLWKCPNCGRQFERQGQTHSCKPFPLKQHFIRKDAGKALYEKLRKAIRKQVGSFKIESLECCIHFVSTSTFAAVKIFKDKIQLDFSLSYQIKSKRIDGFVKMSAHRYLYYISLHSEDEIDEVLLNWVQEAYDLKVRKKIVV
jgi:hypothetical protein